MPAIAFAPRAAPAECGKPTGLGLYHFDARGIDRRFRQAAIFGALEALNPGETMRFYGAEDTLPLLVQIGQRLGARISLSWVSHNPCESIIDFRVSGPHQRR